MESLNVVVSNGYSGGQIISGTPIISGLSKVAKLVYNPEPLGYYYRAFADCMLSTERLLVIGYGGRDEHFNTWITQYMKAHDDKCKVGWLCYLPGDSVGERTPEKDMISSLAGLGKFEEFRHYNYDPGTPKTFHACGHLGLVPSGFPIDASTEQQLVYRSGTSRQWLKSKNPEFLRE